jgi:hypothetical protein
VIDQNEFLALSDCDKWRYVRDLEERQAKLPPQWKPISEHPEEFWDGDQYLVAIRVTDEKNKTTWEFVKIQVDCDSETPVSFYYADSDLIGHREPFTDWCWDDLEFYIKIEETK